MHRPTHKCTKRQKPCDLNHSRRIKNEAWCSHSCLNHVHDENVLGPIIFIFEHIDSRCKFSIKLPQFRRIRRKRASCSHIINTMEHIHSFIIPFCMHIHRVYNASWGRIDDTAFCALIALKDKLIRKLNVTEFAHPNSVHTAFKYGHFHVYWTFLARSIM